MSPLPEVAHAGVIQIGEISLRTYVLDDGRRVVNPEDLEAMLVSWRRGERFTPQEAEQLAAFIRGDA